MRQFVERSLTHQLHITDLFEPRKLLQCSLVYQHPQSIHCFCPGALSVSQQRCLERVIHRIKHHEGRMQLSRINRSFLTAHADRSRIDQNICGRNVINISDTCDSHRCNHILRARLRAIDYCDITCATPCKCCDYRPGRAASTYNHNARPCYADTRLLDCIATTIAIGIGSNHSTIADRNRIYRLCSLCRLVNRS